MTDFPAPDPWTPPHSVASNLPPPRWQDEIEPEPAVDMSWQFTVRMVIGQIAVAVVALVVFLGSLKSLFPSIFPW